MKKVFSFLTVFVLLFALTVPAFAYDYGSGGNLADKTPAMEELYADGYTYAVLVNNGAYQYLYLSTKPFKQNNVNFYIVATESCQYARYIYKATIASWTDESKGTLAAGQEPMSGPFTVQWASYDFYDNTGKLLVEGDENFFPKIPLAELILAVSEEEMVKVAIPEMVGAMKVLVPCGVGLMAFLAVLKLFGKRSLISRP